MLALAAHSAKAGRIETDIDLTKRNPACLEVYAGGVVGPGSGVTVENRCDTPMTLTKVSNGRIPRWLSRGASLSAYLVNPERQYKALTFGSGGSCTYATLPEAKETPCNTITLSPGEAALIFVELNADFRIEGDAGLLIQGRSYQIISAPAGAPNTIGDTATH